ncbi:hypothetical protein ASPTUDRAFT_49952 [Aspergillus tubingensis CBS 134.48]|uniref:Uncharacterized protein n=1 Tax=Aspergillus tubingensis (strain CBS 134.48) TaxID=767770 RepID=A0A1L9NI80_ASPTC|nr:hypothetical protein ASPTUDRAFT_49952 [Aspergillus tubingensis CBS 134.48]
MDKWTMRLTADCSAKGTQHLSGGGRAYEQQATNTYYSIYQEIKVLSGSISDVGGLIAG